MGGRDHSCEGCGNGGFNNDEPCDCLERLTDFVRRVAAVECPHRPDTKAEAELKHLRDLARDLLPGGRA